MSREQNEHSLLEEKKKEKKAEIGPLKATIKEP